MNEIHFHKRRGQGTVVAAKGLQGKGYPFVPDRSGEVARPFHNGGFAKKLNWVLTEISENKGF